MGGQWAVQLLVGVEFCLKASVGDRECFGLLSFALPRVVCSGAVALDPLDTALLLLVIGLRPLTGWQGGLGLREFLAP